MERDEKLRLPPLTPVTQIPKRLTGEKLTEIRASLEEVSKLLKNLEKKLKKKK